MALHACHLQDSVQTPAPADLDRVPDPLGVGGLAHETMIGLLALLLHPGEHLARAVDRGPFLIAGDEQADRAVDLAAARLDIVERRGGEAGDGALHVRRTPAIEATVVDLGREGCVAPQREIAGRDHVDMPGEAKIRRPVADAGVKIVDRRRAFVLEIETPEGGTCGLQR